MTTGTEIAKPRSSLARRIGRTEYLLVLSGAGLHGSPPAVGGESSITAKASRSHRPAQPIHQLVHRAKNDRNVRLCFLLPGLPYEDLAEERLQFLVHELNARFELLKHGFANVQLFTVVDASRSEQQCFPLFLSN